MNNRIQWIDTLKAIGIIFVVLAHCPVPNPLITYIFSFHMPLFFFISGIFFNQNSSFKVFLFKKFQSLLIPYFIFSLISYILWLCIKNYTFYAPVPALMPIMSTLYGSNCKMNFLVHNVFLWFLPCLFMTSLFFYGVHYIFKTRTKVFICLIVLFALGLLTIKFVPFYLPWGMDTAMIATLFYGTGFLAKDKILNMSFKNVNILFIALVSAIISFTVASTNIKIDMNNFIYGNILYFLISAYSGICFWTIISRIIPACSQTIFIGQNSLLIFLIQYPIFDQINFISSKLFHYPLTANLTRLHQINPSANTFLTAALFFITPFLLSIPLSFFFLRYFPIALGVKSPKESLHKSH